MNAQNLIKHLEQLQVEIVGESRGWISARCPFAEFYHSRGFDKRPSFFAHINDTGVSGFNCFTCGQKGQIVSLYKKLGELRKENYMRGIIEAEFDEVPDDFGAFGQRRATVEEAKAVDESIFVGMYPAAWDIADARQYLIDRNVNERAATKLDLLFDPDERRILFPVRDIDFDLFGFTGRTIIEKRDYPYPDFPKVRDYAGLKKEQLLLNEQNFSSNKKTIIVEGLFAVARAVSERADKIANIMATMGAHMSDFQAERLIDHGKPVFLLYDDDEAGDVGLYGRRDHEGNHEGDGAIDKLKKDVSTFVAGFPDNRDDVDDFNTEDFSFAIEEADCVSIDL
jgi:hypothetical protein